ncbi:MAG: glycosyltransferase family 4 protein [Bryobacteraceae bacterium]
MRRTISSGVLCAAVSKATAEHIARRCALPSAGLLSFVPNGVAPPEPREPAFARRAKYELCFVGEVGPRKNWRAAHQAVQALRSTGYPLDLVVVGDGPDASELRWLAAHADGLQFLGPRATARSDVVPYADFLLLPSRSEGAPLVILEALASGVPVLATPVGGIPELIRDGVEGVILSSAKTDSVIEGILRALAMDRRKLAENCRARHSAHFTAHRMASGYRDLYARAIQAFQSTEGPTSSSHKALNH